MRVLAGDIGGTTTRLCIAECAGDACQLLRTQEFASSAYPGLAAILREFLRPEASSALEAGCLAIAGPIQSRPSGQFVKVTNLPWEIDSSALTREVGLPRLRLLNDFEAIGHAVAGLNQADLVLLHAGDPEPRGPRALIGAGTGLGQAILVWQSDRYEVIATEGGHADFGPVDELQLALAHYLLQKFGHASYEMILSGRGLVRLYEFLREAGVAPESPATARAIVAGDPAAAISQAALARSDPLSDAALGLFVHIYGAQAGNLALTAGATGGVYLAGGIAPQILPRLSDGAFLRAYLNKSGMASSYVARVPVNVIVNRQAGLLGAARRAGGCSAEA